MFFLFSNGGQRYTRFFIAQADTGKKIGFQHIPSLLGLLIPEYRGRKCDPFLDLLNDFRRGVFSQRIERNTIPRNDVF